MGPTAHDKGSVFDMNRMYRFTCVACEANFTVDEGTRDEMMRVGCVVCEKDVTSDNFKNATQDTEPG